MLEKQQITKLRKYLNKRAKPVHVNELAKKTKIPIRAINDLLKFKELMPIILVKKYDGRKLMVSLNAFGICEVPLVYKIDLLKQFYLTTQQRINNYV